MYHVLMLICFILLAPPPEPWREFYSDAPGGTSTSGSSTGPGFLDAAAYEQLRQVRAGPTSFSTRRAATPDEGRERHWLQRWLRESCTGCMGSCLAPLPTGVEHGLLAHSLRRRDSTTQRVYLEHLLAQ